MHASSHRNQRREAACQIDAHSLSQTLPSPIDLYRHFILYQGVPRRGCRVCRVLSSTDRFVSSGTHLRFLLCDPSSVNRPARRGASTLTEELDMTPWQKRTTVLSGDEVHGILQCIRSIKHRTFLLTLYAAGLRLSEAAQLTIPDIDGHRMLLTVRCGKGQKDRLVPLSPRLLTELRAYWKEVRSPKSLFPGKTFDRPLSSTTIQKTFKAAAINAGIRKRVTPHTLRHSYAAGLLEAGVDLLTIGQLLGHKSFSTPMVYLHVRRPHLDSTPIPADWLPVRQLPGWVMPNTVGPDNNSASPTSCNSTRRRSCGDGRGRRVLRCRARWQSYHCAARWQSYHCAARWQSYHCAARRHWADIVIAATCALTKRPSGIHVATDTVQDVRERSAPIGCSPHANCCRKRSPAIRWCSLCHSRWLDWRWAIVA
jgi:hypothetical protein